MPNKKRKQNQEKKKQRQWFARDFGLAKSSAAKGTAQKQFSSPTPIDIHYDISYLSGLRELIWQ